MQDFQRILRDQLSTAQLCREGQQSCRDVAALLMSPLALNRDCSAQRAPELLSSLQEPQPLLSPERQYLHSYILHNANRLPWYTRHSEGNPHFNTGHANAHLIGPQGLYHSEQLVVGVTVMEPQLQYPDHTHPPREIYLTLSPGQWRQCDGPWHDPGLDGYVYNSAGVLHSMRSLEQPLIALWCLLL
ncbi:MAG: dimethylsulfonioproprionate lyase family protein [Pseudomonadales bacterium]